MLWILGAIPLSCKDSGDAKHPMWAIDNKTRYRLQDSCCHINLQLNLPIGVFSS